MAACSIVDNSSSNRISAVPKTSLPVDHLTQKIIAYFEEQPLSQRCHPQSTQITLSDEEQSTIKQNWRSTGPDCHNSPFIFLSKGSRHKVYTHQRFPHLVFKPMDLLSATQQACASQQAIDLVIKRNLFLIHIPPGEVIQWEDEHKMTTALYIEELLPIQCAKQNYKRVHASLMTHLDAQPSNIFLNNFKLLISQIADFIIESGYEDVSTENGPLFNAIDGKEVCFTDFEDMEAHTEEAGDGLLYLFEMFPHLTTKEALLPTLSRLSEPMQKSLLHSINATLRESNLDLLGRSDYMPAAFLF